MSKKRNQSPLTDRMKEISGQKPYRPGLAGANEGTDIKVDDFMKELAGIKPSLPGLSDDD